MPHANSVFDESHWLLSPGPLASHVRDFAAELVSLGYARGTMIHYCAGARHFAAWLQRQKITLDIVDDQTIEMFARHRCECLGVRERRPLRFQYVNRVRRFVGFLKKKGMVQLPEGKPPCREDERIAGFLEWSRVHRGITAITAREKQAGPGAGKPENPGVKSDRDTKFRPTRRASPRTHHFSRCP